MYKDSIFLSKAIFIYQKLYFSFYGYNTSFDSYDIATNSYDYTQNRYYFLFIRQEEIIGYTMFNLFSFSDIILTAACVCEGERCAYLMVICKLLCPSN